jgi:CubicO group peptidase (beta-lactamase class C family)
MSNFPIHGDLPDKFSGLRDVIAQNAADHDELGFQFCVMQHGETLIDLRGGWTDRKHTAEVAEDTLFAVFSSGKAMAALVIAWLVEDDRLGYNQAVATLWPEFAAAGKGALSVAEVLSHQAGLSGITNPDWTPPDWFDWDKTVAELAAQTPIFPAASASGYHPVTYGFLAGEIARHADADMRTLGTILREELSQPFDADVWIGLPPSEHDRCAQMQKPRALTDFGEVTDATRAAFLQPWSSPGGRGVAAWREAELAGSNCHATAKGLATLMQMGVDGQIGGRPILSEDTLAGLSQSRVSGRDRVLPFDLDIAAGVMRNAPNFYYGPTAETLGHSGWGGSCVFADPVTGLHGAYVMNRQRNILMGDARATGLINAVYAAL